MLLKLESFIPIGITQNTYVGILYFISYACINFGYGYNGTFEGEIDRPSNY